MKADNSNHHVCNNQVTFMIKGQPDSDLIILYDHGFPPRNRIGELFYFSIFVKNKSTCTRYQQLLSFQQVEISRNGPSGLIWNLTETNYICYLP